MRIVNDQKVRGYIIKVFTCKFGIQPKFITPMTTGLANEVYMVNYQNKEAIIRLNKNSSPLKGSSHFIPLFKAQGIRVPEIIFEDYSKKLVPYYYQILTKLPGTDIKNVVHKLSTPQLKSIAKELALIIKKLRRLPTSGKYGYRESTVSGLSSSWTLVMRKMIQEIRQRGKKNHLIDTKIDDLLNILWNEYKPYFNSVPSIFYYDDMSSKNVMIEKGKFTGLVDVDGVVYGDYLEAIGRIKASWYGTKYGALYAEAVMKELRLNNKQREMVTVYAILNRIFWLSRMGGNFNLHTPKTINKQKVTQSKKIIHALYAELKN